MLIRLAAAPVQSAANHALVAALADLLGCPRRAVSIVSGEKSRDKRVRVEGFTAEELERRLAPP